MDEYLNKTESTVPASKALLSDINLPITLLALAFSVFIFAQISNLGQAARSMKWQSDNLDRQIASLTESEKRFNDLIQQREALVQQSQQVQGRYTEMLTDLIELAEDDADARAIVEKYRIQRQQRQDQNAGAAGAAGAAEPTPSPTP
ncbi:MAG: hypothetical protein KGR46_12065 [Verrucomicrobia bacterium]|nr:hypothetical protein [Verrucomicrobiota bacterium]